MWNDRTSSQGQTRSARARRWLAVCCARRRPASRARHRTDVEWYNVTVLKSGLHSIFEGHTLLLTVTEVGSTTSASTVTIEFLDALDQRRAIHIRHVEACAPRATAGRCSCRSRLSTPACHREDHTAHEWPRRASQSSDSKISTSPRSRSYRRCSSRLGRQEAQVSKAIAAAGR